MKIFDFIDFKYLLFDQLYFIVILIIINIIICHFDHLLEYFFMRLIKFLNLNFIINY